MDASNQAGLPETLPLEIDVDEAAASLRSEEAPLLLDVREHSERAFCRIGDELHIPIAEIPHRWDFLPRDKHLLVYCHHGMRSLRVTHFLRQAGLPKVQSLRGGIEAWSLQIDSSVPRY
ncbi:MAG: rhodanese-like domain-containing protein [Puniceicoccaceae bacterium]